ASDHPHRRRLAGAVGTQESQDLAARHGEADVVDGGDRAEPSAQILYFQKRRHLLLCSVRSFSQIAAGIRAFQAGRRGTRGGDFRSLCAKYLARTPARLRLGTTPLRQVAALSAAGPQPFRPALSAESSCRTRPDSRAAACRRAYRLAPG